VNHSNRTVKNASVPKIRHPKKLSNYAQLRYLEPLSRYRQYRTVLANSVRLTKLSWATCMQETISKYHETKQAGYFKNGW
jgi:hypothetical protein